MTAAAADGRGGGGTAAGKMTKKGGSSNFGSREDKNGCSSLDRYARRFDEDDQSSFGSSAGSIDGGIRLAATAAAAAAGRSNDSRGRGGAKGAARGAGTTNLSSSNMMSSSNHSVGDHSHHSARSIHTASTNATIGSVVRRRENIERHDNDQRHGRGGMQHGSRRGRPPLPPPQQQQHGHTGTGASVGGGGAKGGGRSGSSGGGGRMPFANKSSKSNSHRRVQVGGGHRDDAAGTTGIGGMTVNGTRDGGAKVPPPNGRNADRATPHSLKTPKMTNTAAAVAAAKAKAAAKNKAKVDVASATASGGGTDSHPSATQSARTVAAQEASKRSRKSLLLHRKAAGIGGSIGGNSATGALAASPASRNCATSITSATGTGKGKLSATPTKSPRSIGKSEPLRSTSAKKKRKKLQFDIFCDDGGGSNKTVGLEETKPTRAGYGRGIHSADKSNAATKTRSRGERSYMPPSKTANIPRPGFIQESPPSGLEESPAPANPSFLPGIEASSNRNGKEGDGNNSPGDASKESKDGMDCSEDDRGLGIDSPSSTEASSDDSLDLRDKVASRCGTAPNGKKRFSIRMPSEVEEARQTQRPSQPFGNSSPGAGTILDYVSHRPDDESAIAAMLNSSKVGSGWTSGGGSTSADSVGLASDAANSAKIPPKNIVGSTIKIHRSPSLDASEMTSYTAAAGGYSKDDKDLTATDGEKQYSSDTDGSVSVESEEPYSAGLIAFIQQKVPPRWIVRLSMSKNKPFYSHPDFGQSWYCPVNVDYSEYYSALASAPSSPAQTSVSGSFAESPPSEPSLEERLNRSATSPPGSDVSSIGIGIANGKGSIKYPDSFSESVASRTMAKKKQEGPMDVDEELGALYNQLAATEQSIETAESLTALASAVVGAHSSVAGLEAVVEQLSQELVMKSGIGSDVEIAESVGVDRLSHQLRSGGTVAGVSSKSSDRSLRDDPPEHGAKDKGDATTGGHDPTDSLVVHNDELEATPKLPGPERLGDQMAGKLPLPHIASATHSEYVEEMVVASIGFDHSATLHQASEGVAGILENASSEGGGAITSAVVERKVVDAGGDVFAKESTEEEGTTQPKFEEKELHHGGLDDGGFQYHGVDDFDVDGGGDFPLCDDGDFDDDDELNNNNNNNNGDILAETEGKPEAGMDPDLSLSPPLFGPSPQKKRKSICASPTGSLDLTKSSESSDEEVSEVKLGHHRSRKDKAELVEEIEINSDDSSMVSSLAVPAAGRGRKGENGIHRR